MSKALMTVLLALSLASIGAATLKSGMDGVRALAWGAEEVFSPPLASIKHKYINYGAFNPDYLPDGVKNFHRAKWLAIDHIFVSWLDRDLTIIERKSAGAVAANRWLLLTIEPFPDERTASAETLLSEVAVGRYDDRVDAMCGAIGATHRPVLVRWGHEMETPSVRYAWAGRSGDLYTAAYRYFVNRCRTLAPKALFVWSPRGDVGLAEYYPGKAYVDYVGLSVYGLPQRDMKEVGHVRSFIDEFKPRYERVITFNLPVMIAELGVSGDDRFQRAWMRQLFRRAGEFPLLKTAVYFNAVDSPGAWPSEYGVPDWRIAGDIFD